VEDVLADTQAPLAQAYSAFHRREEIRAYWTRQWAQFKPQVEPLEVAGNEAGGTERMDLGDSEPAFGHDYAR
jgi:hypothetical protein